MLKHNAIPTLTPDLVSERFDDYPEQVLDCEWNPALEQVLRLREHRTNSTHGLYLLANQPELPEASD